LGLCVNLICTPEAYRDTANIIDFYVLMRGVSLLVLREVAMQTTQTIRRRLYQWLLMLWPLLAFTSCVLPTPPAVTVPTATPPPGANATVTTATPVGEAPVLAGTRWQLVAYGAPGTETPVIDGSPITLQFGTAGEVNGYGGCNEYSGAYTVEANTLLFGEIVSTLRACADQTVTVQEVDYLAALRSASRFEIAEDMLTIWYDNENGTLTFTQAPTSPLDATPVITPGVPITKTEALTA
jgi:heat shock protein HslJ